jgi:hypothetical protein
MKAFGRAIYFTSLLLLISSFVRADINTDKDTVVVLPIRYLEDDGFTIHQREKEFTDLILSEFVEICNQELSNVFFINQAEAGISNQYPKSTLEIEVYDFEPKSKINSIFQGNYFSSNELIVDFKITYSSGHAVSVGGNRISCIARTRALSIKKALIRSFRLNNKQKNLNGLNRISLK